MERAKVDEIANLARLKLTEALSVKMTGQLGSILDYIDQLKEVKTEGVEPFICAPSAAQAGDVANVHFRPDAVKASLPHAQVLQNAAQRDETYFRVPPPLKGEAEE